MNEHMDQASIHFSLKKSEKDTVTRKYWYLEINFKTYASLYGTKTVVNLMHMSITRSEP